MIGSYKDYHRDTRFKIGKKKKIQHFCHCINLLFYCCDNKKINVTNRRKRFLFLFWGYGPRIIKSFHVKETWSLVINTRLGTECRQLMSSTRSKKGGDKTRNARHIHTLISYLQWHTSSRKETCHIAPPKQTFPNSSIS